MLAYNTQDMNKCEYIESMRKVGFERPEQKDGKCDGYVSKYSNKASFVCAKCPNFGRCEQ